jgi:hypothetical protein
MTDTAPVTMLDDIQVTESFGRLDWSRLGAVPDVPKDSDTAAALKRTAERVLRQRFGDDPLLALRIVRFVQGGAR